MSKVFVTAAKTLTPTLSRKREREQETLTGSLSRVRERARVRARALRKGQTDAEAVLWSRLRSRQLRGLKFRRQHPLGPYFADFACVECGLVVELDGGQHVEGAALVYDERRAQAMASMGFTTLRFWDNQVLMETEGVLERILQTAQTLTPALSRGRERESTSRTE